MPDATRTETLKLDRQYRFLPVERAETLEPDEDGVVRVDLSFSSEEPYERFFGIEVLGHSAGEVDMARLQSGTAPLLFNHHPDRLIGVVESAAIGRDRKGRARVRLGTNADAERAVRDLADGLLRNVSVGYQVREMRETARNGDVSTYRVTAWEPVEISLVSVPADPTVGVGRADSDPAKPVIVIRMQQEAEMPEENTTPAAEPATATRTAAPPAIDQSALRREAERLAEERLQARQNDMGEILAIGDRWGMRDAAREAIQKGTPLAEFRTQVMAAKEAELERGGTPVTHLDMAPKQRGQYSLLRAVRAAKSGDWSKAGFERECSIEISERLDRSPNGFFVPADVFAKRELTAGTLADGGELVATDHRADMFIELLRPRMLVTQMGARVMSGLTGNPDIPRLTGGATFSWGAEAADATASDQQFDSVSLTPNQGSARTIISRRLINQSSPSAEALVIDDLQRVVAIGIDLAAINGSGSSNQPEGILNVTGIGSVAGGTNGAAPDWADIVALETAVAIDNADMGALGYLTNAKVRGKLKVTPKESGQAIYVFEDGMDGFGRLNGYRAGVSNQVPSNLTKGTASGICSAIIFGNFADLIIGTWGVLDLQITNNTRADGGTDLRIFHDVDVAVRHPESFAAMKDALTT